MIRVCYCRTLINLAKPGCLIKKKKLCLKLRALDLLYDSWVSLVKYSRIIKPQIAVLAITKNNPFLLSCKNSCIGQTLASATSDYPNCSCGQSKNWLTNIAYQLEKVNTCRSGQAVFIYAVSIIIQINMLA